ncbi:MAG: hypothetical protein GY790_10285 [Bacteroidetes bacterium]|nr:hypothetical protein [Bacteroidota bacterium]
MISMTPWSCFVVPDEMPAVVTVMAPEYIEHSGTIEADETWNSGVHVITADIYVNGAILTIEPGAVVRINSGYGIYIGYYEGAGSSSSFPVLCDATPYPVFHRILPGILPGMLPGMLFGMLFGMLPIGSSVRPMLSSVIGSLRAIKRFLKYQIVRSSSSPWWLIGAAHRGGSSGRLIEVAHRGG